MVEFIRHIPGPIFLALFAAFSALCVILARLLTDADGSIVGASGEPTGLDPVAVALMQGGVNSVIRSRVFSLTKQGLVSIEGEKKDTSVFAARTAQSKGLSALDREILSFLSVKRTPGELFTDSGLKAGVEGHLAPVRTNLERLGLLRNEGQRARSLRIAFFFAALIASLGGLKLYLGITRGKPVAFLVILLIASEVLLFVLLRQGTGLTKLGRRHLKTLKERFGWTLKRQTLPDGVDTTLLVAMYGAGLMSVSSAYPGYSAAFKRNSTGTSGCSGGCGSGCSGGCGGGGCGGCGGCGG